jgi:DNA invertase Pin-like site-specific DNA recombinase
MLKSNTQNRLIGYARVSTTGPLMPSWSNSGSRGCSPIFQDAASGARVDRRELQKTLGVLAAGDVVTVTRINRHARSTFDLFAIVKRIADAGAEFRSPAHP